MLFRNASEFFARASVEIVVATVCISGVSHVAASPIACGNTVAYPDRAIPCSPSLHATTDTAAINPAWETHTVANRRLFLNAIYFGPAFEWFISALQI